MSSTPLNKVLFGLNLLLAGMLTVLALYQHKVQPPPPSDASVGTQTPAPELDQPNLSQYASLAGQADWWKWINALRDAGVPARVLARLVREGFDDAWQKRAREIQSAYRHGTIDSDGVAAANLSHDLEQEKAIRAALGEEDFKAWDMTNVLQGIDLKGIQLTTAESESLYELEKKTRQRADILLLSKLNGEIDQATLSARLATNQADHDVQLNLVLGDLRYATMQGSDEGAGDLQRDLSEVTLPADVSFDSLLAKENAWNERRQAMVGQIQAARSQIENFEQEVKKVDDERTQEFQRLLGTNGFDALQKSQDNRYTEMKRYADTWRLDNTSIDYIYQTIKFYEKSVQDYQQQAKLMATQGQDVDWAAVNQNIQQFAEQNQQALRTYLGDNRYEKIKNNAILPLAPTDQVSPPN